MSNIIGNSNDHDDYVIVAKPSISGAGAAQTY